MSRTKQKQKHRPGKQKTSTPLAFLLRDPHSLDELRRTIDAWSRFIERHLHDDYADVRGFAQMAIVRRAAAYAILGEHTAALADVQMAQAEASGDSYIQCKALEVKAIVQADQDDNPGALATFAEVWPLLLVAEIPLVEQAELWLARGKCYGRLDRYEEAIADFTQAQTLDPRCGEALCWRGLAQVFAREDRRPQEAALADVARAADIEPYNATCHRIRGVILRMADCFAESLRALCLAETLDPADPWVQRNKQETLGKWLWCCNATNFDEELEEMGRILAERPKTTKPASRSEPVASSLPVASEPIPPPPVLRTSKNEVRRSRSKAASASDKQGLFF